MAKIILENRFILTKKLHAEYCRETYKKMRKRTRAICFILALVMLLAAILTGIFIKSEKLVLVFLVLMVYFIITGLIGYKVSEWLNYRSLQREHGENVVMLLTFTPAQVLVKVNKTSFAFKYTTINSVLETEHLFILILSKKGMIEHGQVLFKEGFKGGDLDDFKRLLNEKSGRTLFE